MADDRPVLAMVLKGYPRISETFISNEIRLLEEMGLRIRIISMRRPRESFAHASVSRIKADVVYLPEMLTGHWGEFLRRNLRQLRARPVAYLKATARMLRQFVKTRRSASLKHLLQAGYLLQDPASDPPAAHFHAHFAHSPGSVARYAAMLTGLPFSFTGHAKDVYTQKPAALTEKIRHAAFAVTCTGHNRDYLERLAAGRTPVHLVYHGIDLSLFSPGPPPPLKPPYRILSVARLTAKKGLPTVLRALGLLAEMGLDFTCDVIGEGEDRQKLEALAGYCGISTRVFFHGAMPHEKVLDFYRAAHAFVLGCQVLPNGDRDGIPNVLVESMAMGVPVAATSVSAIPELVTEGETGLLVPPGDPEALAQAVHRLVTDAGLRGRIIPAAMEKVRRDFDNTVHTARLADIFRQRAGSPPGIFA
ncbi:glycosyltransferase family 4 protein [Desulfolutivibrio sulfoxidireducens]|uniref:glycosyltransferase family 4 protein n=1 Tax=Desulfolutivibrio sulfoxidireducens TaxID=2773299 RepID=UPI00159DFA50|nr:glycosyltransferase family 4 protein [Desulfolutivibrio sulfoxidireducens]QLA17159.1 glycosyltransferase [Desulfolutivibrio sulfoxidireducens]